MDKNKTIYSRIENLARKHQCSPAQLALAWVFKQGQDVAPIPGNWLSFFFLSWLITLAKKCALYLSFKNRRGKVAEDFIHCYLYHYLLRASNWVSSTPSLYCTSPFKLQQVELRSPASYRRQSWHTSQGKISQVSLLKFHKVFLPQVLNLITI